jgi:anti-anti-sigma factor
MIALTWHPPAPAGRPLVEVIVCETLDGDAAARLGTLLDDLLAREPGQLIIDLAKCPFIDAEAVDILLRAHRRAWLAGGLLTLREPSQRVRRILKLAKVDHVLDTTSSGAAGPLRPATPDDN